MFLLHRGTGVGVGGRVGHGWPCPGSVRVLPWAQDLHFRQAWNILELMAVLKRLAKLHWKFLLIHPRGSGKLAQGERPHGQSGRRRMPQQVEADHGKEAH